MDTHSALKDGMEDSINRDNAPKNGIEGLVDRENLPNDGIEGSTGSENVTNDEIERSTGSENVTNDGIEGSTGSENVTNGGLEGSTDTNHGMERSSDSENASGNGIERSVDKENILNDEIEGSADSECLIKDGIEGTGNRENVPNDGIEGSSDRENVPNDGIERSGNRKNSSNDRIERSADRRNSSNDRIERSADIGLVHQVRIGDSTVKTNITKDERSDAVEGETFPDDEREVTADREIVQNRRGELIYRRGAFKDGIEGSDDRKSVPKDGMEESAGNGPNGGLRNSDDNKNAQIGAIGDSAERKNILKDVKEESDVIKKNGNGDVRSQEDSTEQNTSNMRKTSKEKILCEAKLVQKSSPSVYQLPTKVIAMHTKDRLLKLHVGEQSVHQMEKIIMMVGATGGGKSTLINAMVNHIYGVKWSDDYRFKLIVEPTSINQACSQTSWITAYTLKHQKDFTVPYTLTIIDTPGFGDTQGIHRDKEITRQMRKFFETAGVDGIDHIDAIGFVVQASLPRLTASQKYIFDSVLSIFGKDIAENIYMMVTFADAKKPPVLSGIKEANIPHAKYFKFNNSAFFPAVAGEEEEDNEDVEEFDRMYWKTGNMSFKNFLTELNTTSSKSLVLTKEVLDERNKLEIYIIGLQDEIKQGLSKLDNLNQTHQILQDKEAEIIRNKDYVINTTHDEWKHVTLPPGIYTTTCLQCNRTCHLNCAIKNDNEKNGCIAMSNGYCTVCPNQCHWSAHLNLPYKVESVTVTKQETAKDLYAKYQKASEEKITHTQVLERMNDEFEAIQLVVFMTTDEVRKSLARLQVIALKPNPLSTVDYIDLLITSEEDEVRQGWRNRVKQLQEVRKEAEYIQNVTLKGFDPFCKHRPAFMEKVRREEIEKKPGAWTRVKEVGKRFRSNLVFWR